MIIIGSIGYTGPLVYLGPIGMLLNIAANGSPHVLAQSGGGSSFRFADCTNMVRDATQLSNTTFRTDCAAQLGLVDGGSGAEIIGMTVCYQVPGTSQFLVLGQSFNAAQNSYQVYGFLYRIDSIGNVSIVYKYHWLQNTLGWLAGDGVAGAQGVYTDGTYLYFVAGFGHFFVNFRENFVRINITQNEVDITPSSWENNHIFAMPAGDMTATSWWVSSTPMNRATIHKVTAANSYSCMNYRTIRDGEVPTKLWQTIIDVTAGPPGTNTGKTDVSSKFGIPFADEGLNSVGTPTGAQDYYTNPCITELGGGLLEVVFMRGYTDVDSLLGARRFITDLDLNVVTTFPLLQLTLSAGFASAAEAVHLFRQPSDINHAIFMIREDNALIFETFTIPPFGVGDIGWHALLGPIYVED